MLRFVIRRRLFDGGTGLATEGLETIDANCPELERVLSGGRLDPPGVYDHREVAGVEVLPDSEPRFTADQLASACALAGIPDSEYQSLLMELSLDARN